MRQARMTIGSVLVSLAALAAVMAPVRVDAAFITAHAFCFSDLAPNSGRCEVGPGVVGSLGAEASMSRGFTYTGINWGVTAVMSLTHDTFAASAFSGGSFLSGNPDSLSQFNSTAIGNIFDEITVPGAPGGTGSITFNWHVTGGAEGGRQNGGIGGSVGVSCTASNSPGVALPCLGGLGLNFGAGDVSVEEDVSLVVPFVFNVPTDFTITVVTLANAFARAPAGLITTAIMDVDFGHTGTLTSVIVRDADGNVIENPTIVSESGFDYTAVGAAQPPDPGETPSAPVPEPASLVMMTAGLLGVAILRRRR